MPKHRERISPPALRELERSPILIESLLAELQLGLTNPIHSFPLSNQVQEITVDSYLEKPLIVDTINTVDKPKVVYKVSYKPTPSSVDRVYADNVEIIGYSSLQCVETFKMLSGITRPLGYAGNIPSQGNEPRIGAGALWKGYGHIGYVSEINENMITVIDSNWERGKLTKHILTVDNFRGFIYN